MTRRRVNGVRRKIIRLRRILPGHKHGKTGYHAVTLFSLSVPCGREPLPPR
jgi:hypothetical protein